MICAPQPTLCERLQPLLFGAEPPRPGRAALGLPRPRGNTDGEPEHRAVCHIHPNRDTILTGSDDDTVRLWDTDPAMAKKDICSLIVTPITAAEWTKYVPGITYWNPCTRASRQEARRT